MLQTPPTSQASAGAFAFNLTTIPQEKTGSDTVRPDSPKEDTSKEGKIGVVFVNVQQPNLHIKESNARLDDKN